MAQHDEPRVATSDGAPGVASAPVRAALLLCGTLVLGVGVACLLKADLGSDGYSTLVNGISLSASVPFYAANAALGALFLAVAWARHVRPGVGTLTQIVVVGVTVWLLLDWLPEPTRLWERVALLAVALGVLALGVALYLGSQTGAGPAEAAALAWDPPLAFRVSYSAMQGTAAVLGWFLGASIGIGTVAVVVLLGPMIAWCARRLHLVLEQ